MHAHSARCGLRSRLTADYELLSWAARGRSTAGNAARFRWLRPACAG